MKVKQILFKIETDWNNTTYDSLIQLAVNKEYNRVTKVYEWTFDIKDLTKVIAILGTPLDLTNYEDDILKLVDLCPPIKQKVATEEWKGVSGIKIIKYPKIYKITEFRKDNEGKPHELNHEIPVENVNIAWEVISKQPLDTWVKSRTIAEHICNSLGLKRFFRETGTFSWEKFFGSRKDYCSYFYFPIKVLQEHYKVINYHKKGKIMKIKTEWNTETNLC